MPCDKIQAHELASENLDGPHSRAAFNEAALRRMRRSAPIGQAVATGRCAWEAARAEGMIIRAYSVFWIVLVLAGCSTTDAGQVKEIEPGTYKIGVSARGNSVLIAGHDATDAAVEQAGQYCHAKGQKLVIVPAPGRDVTFRCGDITKP